MSSLVNPVGLKMLEWVAPIYGESEQMQILFEAIGSEMENAEYLLDEVRKQLDISQATWGIHWWEDRVGIVRNTGLSDAARRALVIIQMQMHYSGNPKKMEDYLETVDGVDDALVLPWVSSYTFGVEITQDPLKPLLSKKIVDIIERTKSAHMSYLIFYTFLPYHFTVASTLTDQEFRLTKCGESVCGTLPQNAQIRNN